MIIAAHKNRSRDYKRAKDLRHASSPPEQKLWRRLQELHQKSGIKFRRQQPLSPYIVDFACMEAKLVIELDGDSHATSEEYDRKRDDYLRRQGFKVVRFSNHELAINEDGVVETAALMAKKLIKEGNPSPAKSKGLAEAKPKISLPLPQGERNNP